MKGSSHTGFALAGAMIMNSTCYLLHPQPFMDGWDRLLHAVGPPFTYQTFVTFFHQPYLLWNEAMGWTFLSKFLFYGMLIASVMWPDRIERRKTGEYRFPHRGPTHSVAMLVLLVTGVGLAYEIVLAYIHLYHVVISDGLFRIVCTLAVSIICAFFLHSVADMFTRDGVKFWWPHNADVGLPPVKTWRPTVDSELDLAWLWLIIFITGMLFAAGWVGI